MNRKERRAAGKATGASPAAPSSPVDRQFAQAVQHFQAGRPDLAEAGFHQVLQNAPNHADALTYLGFLKHRAGAHEAAISLLQAAIAARPAHGEAHATLGSVLQALGRIEEAIASYRGALAIQPRFGPVLCNLGNVLQLSGRFGEAVDCYRRALAVNQNDAATHSNLGSALKALGKLDEAAASYRRALALQPAMLEANLNLANIWLTQGRLDEAAASYREILATRPDLAVVHSNLSMVLRVQGKISEAIEACRRSLAVNPADAAAYCNLGNLQMDAGQLDAARESFQRGVAVKPDYAELRSNLLFLLNYDPAVDDPGLLAAHRDFDRHVTAPLRRFAPDHANDRDPERPFRVGYVSADFYRHPVGYFFLPVIRAHDRDVVAAYCYSGRAVEDDLTPLIRDQADVWRSTIGIADADLAEQIRADGIDILVDLSGHTAGNRLAVFGRKPAPVQASWIGYFNTTGVSAIDYALMDAATVPAGSERWFTEDVVRLPGGRFCYAPPDYAPAVAPAPALARGHVTFGSFNNLSKVTPDVVALWARVLQAVPGSRLLLKWKSLADAAERARFQQAFGSHGIDPARLELRPGTPHDAMLAEYGEVDIGLDPFPFCGGLTSCEALWMGVPIITLPGTRPVSRQTLGLLEQLGLAALAADSADAYVALAAGLAGDRARLVALRGSLRARMAASPLCDGPRFARDLEAAYRMMWRRWCARPI